MKSSPTSSTTNTSSYIDPWLASDSQQAASSAMSSIPGYTAYTGPNTQAGLTANQTQASNLAGSTAGQGQAIAQGGQSTLQGASNLGVNALNGTNINGLAAQLGQGTNSQLQAAISANDAANTNATQQGLSTLDNNLAGQGAFGGSRQGAADAGFASQMAIGNNQTNANLINSWAQNNQNAAMNALQGNNSTALAGATGLGNLGTTISGLNTNDISNLANTGATAQNTQSGQNAFDYQNYLEGYQIPDTQASTLAGVLGSLPHDSTGTSNTQSQMYSSLLGPAMIGLSLFSDRRLKTDIEHIGTLPNGAKVYEFRYKGANHTKHIGFMAQEVYEWCPEAVLYDKATGYFKVDYRTAFAKAFA